MADEEKDPRMMWMRKHRVFRTVMIVIVILLAFFIGVRAGERRAMYGYGGMHDVWGWGGGWQGGYYPMMGYPGYSGYPMMGYPMMGGYYYGGTGFGAGPIQMMYGTTSVPAPIR